MWTGSRCHRPYILDVYIWRDRLEHLSMFTHPCTVKQHARRSSKSLRCTAGRRRQLICHCPGKGKSSRTRASDIIEYNPVYLQVCTMAAHSYRFDKAVEAGETGEPKPAGGVGLPRALRHSSSATAWQLPRAMAYKLEAPLELLLPPKARIDLTRRGTARLATSPCPSSPNLLAPCRRRREHEQASGGRAVVGKVGKVGA